jgi:hypothetical protein
MGEAAKALVPLYVFMLIPLWIPLIAIGAGSFADRVAVLRGGRRPGLAEQLRPGSTATDHDAARHLAA